MKPSFKMSFHCLWDKSNRTCGQFECEVNCFVLISFVHMLGMIWRGGKGVCLKLEPQGQGGRKFSDLDGKGCEGP